MCPMSLFNKYLLNAYYEPDNTLGTRWAVVNDTAKALRTSEV